MTNLCHLAATTDGFDCVKVPCSDCPYVVMPCPVDTVPHHRHEWNFGAPDQHFICLGVKARDDVEAVDADPGTGDE